MLGSGGRAINDLYDGTVGGVAAVTSKFLVALLRSYCSSALFL